MTQPIRVIQYGLGPIGCAVARLAASRDGLTLVGGVDIDPAKAGRDVGEVAGLPAPLGVPVTRTLAETLDRTGADVVLHTTSSYFDLFKPQILEILEAGLDVVSTAEELSFPWRDHRAEAEEIDAAARKAGKTVLGTGVNPGFLMDTLPLALSGICQEVRHVAVTRVINASTRRGPFQKKIGAGMTVEAFREQMAAGRMGHVGLPESMAMLFDTLGQRLVRYEDGVEPVVAETPVETEHVRVGAGQVRGLRQVARGFTDTGEFAVLTFIAALAEEDDGDTIRLTGRPDLEVRLRGTNGDLSTVAIAVNAVRRVHEAAPGLVTMRDLPVVSAW
ncbi:dihydrodipicolinate reductase [Rhodocaloribacter litoris]|uniref:NAD(P)H-dependent amine dehydrogenase family protein n=1 Tax=Rhodocaloribacter litoris TaxID=2558931 RepID=UPI0014247603|nr:dihydrodipicolinate reductase [Rhodocaloribacter litoris]QXD16143.1 dihydrodipicolinate reductase [Rhodocaloribacter litoris]